MLARLLSVVLCFKMILSLSVCAGNVDDKFYKEDDPTRVIYDAGRKVSLEKLTVTIAKFWVVLLLLAYLPYVCVVWM